MGRRYNQWYRRQRQRGEERAEMFGTIETDPEEWQSYELTKAQKDALTQKATDEGFFTYTDTTEQDEISKAREETEQHWNKVDAARAKREHAFWTTPNAQYEPKLKFRFFVRIPGMGLEDNRAKKDLTTFETMMLGAGTKPWSDPSAYDAAFADAQTPNGDLIWYAKTIDKPSYTIANLSEGKYPRQGVMATPRLTNSPKFAPIKMTLIDPSYPNATRKLLRLLRRTGYLDDKANEAIAKNAGLGEVDTDARSSSLTDSVGDVQIFQIDAQGTTVERWVLREAFPAEVSYGTLDYSSNDPVEISVTWNYTSFYCDFPEIGKELAYTYNPNKDANWSEGEWDTQEDLLNNGY